MELNFKKKKDLRSISLSLDKEMIDELEKLAKFYKRSVSEVTREILHNVLTRKGHKDKLKKKK